MRARRLMSGARLSQILFALAAFVVRCESAAGSQDDSADKAIAGLRQITSELDQAVKSFQTHLNREIALHDQGYRIKGGGRRIPGADVDLNGGQADVVQTAMRKLFAARMISARRPGYAPAPLADADRLQALIDEARRRVNSSNEVVRRLLIVSAKELNSPADTERKARRIELLKARSAAAEAAKKAFVALPIALPEADSPEAQRERAWDSMVAKIPRVTPAATGAQERQPREDTVFPIRFEEGKRIILVNEHFCRVTLTDSGIEDRQGRRLFYQEEWVTRQGSVARTTGNGPAGIVVWMRWAVAVDTKTGQHTLLRRYGPREFRGDFNDIYQLQVSDDISNVKLTENSVPPSAKELASAVAAVERSRKELGETVADFRRQIRDALARNDALLAARDGFALDDDLPNDLREKLFTIRYHLAGTTAILDAENKVRRAVEGASGNLRALEALVAWVNGSSFETGAPAQDSRALLEAQNRFDTGILLIRSLEREALAALPPDLPMPEAQLPALRKDLIVRIRRLETARYRQEVWGLEGAHLVKRTIVFVEVDAKSGSQIPTGREVKEYPIEPGEILEEVYDENAAQ